MIHKSLEERIVFMMSMTIRTFNAHTRAVGASWVTTVVVPRSGYENYVSAAAAAAGINRGGISGTARRQLCEPIVRNDVKRPGSVLSFDVQSNVDITSHTHPYLRTHKPVRVTHTQTRKLAFDDELIHTPTSAASFFVIFLPCVRV